MDLVEKIITCHLALAEAEVPHAFGGALALAWCTQQARGTIDIDLNIFTGRESITQTLSALPAAVDWQAGDVRRLEAELQHRLWWDKTPLDLFFNSTDYHQELASRVRWETFAGHELPFLSCVDLAIFKVIFDRTKDWADLEAMQAAGTLHIGAIRPVVVSFIGAEDSRLARLDALAVVS